MRTLLLILLALRASAGAAAAAEEVHAASTRTLTQRPRSCLPECVATLALDDSSKLLLQSGLSHEYPGRAVARQLRYRVELHPGRIFQASQRRGAGPVEDQGGRAGGAVSATSLQRLAARALRRTPWASASASLQPSPAREYLLQVVYKDTYNTTGWDRLEVHVNPAIPVPDWVKAHALGYAEAFFTWPQIYNYWDNYRQNEFAAGGGEPNPDLVDWIEKQEAFVRGQVSDKRQSSKFWRLVGLVLTQFDGLVEGYQRNAPPGESLTWQDLYLLQSVGDLYDLSVLFPPGGGKKPANGSVGQGGAQGRRYVPHHGALPGPGEEYGGMLECSALIRVDNASILAAGSAQEGGEGAGRRPASAVGAAQGLLRRARAAAWRGARAVLRRWGWLGPCKCQQRQGQEEGPEARVGAAGGPGPADVVPFWAGHATWRPYYAMVRTFKTYDVPWSETGPLVVSGSPGLLYSKDDYYTTDSLFVIETTLGIYNHSLYDAITHECALIWQRVLAATYGSTNGREWTMLFARKNSGTYNNQWMVLDVNALNRRWQHDLLWIIEQVPGYTQKADVTSVLLQTGMWASFNVPWFENIYNLTGYPHDAKLIINAPRAKIFARDGPQVSSVSALKRLLRYNKYQTDPLSEGRPDRAVAMRGDLAPTSHAGGNWTRRAFGAVDAKLVDAQAFSLRRTHAVCGPTSDDQVPFRWSTSGFDAVHHAGSSDLFDFDWQVFEVGS